MHDVRLRWMVEMSGAMMVPSIFFAQRMENLRGAMVPNS